MSRRVSVIINCNKTTCGEHCKWLDLGNVCTLFKVKLKPKKQGKAHRHIKCLHSELLAIVGTNGHESLT
jgi:hypothetical protein